MYVYTYLEDGFDDGNNNKMWQGYYEVARPDWSVALLLVLVSVSPIWLAQTVYG